MDGLLNQLNANTSTMVHPNSTNITDSGEAMLTENFTMQYLRIPMIIIYILIFMTGVVGNVCTCIVISKNRSMHTATNYYLFSLAVSDFLLLITGMPQDLYSTWNQIPLAMGYVLCVGRGLIAEAGANATVLTITAFTVERYVAICHPFLSHTLSKLSRAVRLILVIWLISIVIAIPTAKLIIIDEHNFCQIQPAVWLLFETSAVFMFIIPMIVITVLYALIGFKLRSSSQMKRANGSIFQQQRRTVVNVNSCRQQTNKSTRRVLKMLVAVVVAFFICWAPFHAQRLVVIRIENHIENNNIYAITTCISGILYFLSTCINPLLYNIMSNKFREAFKETLAKGLCCIGVSSSRYTDDCAERRKSYNRVLSRHPQRRRTFNSSGLPESTTTDCSASTSVYSTSTCTQLQSTDEAGSCMTQVSPICAADAGRAHANSALLCLVPGRRRRQRFRKSSRKRDTVQNVRIADGDLGVEGAASGITTLRPLHDDCYSAEEANIAPSPYRKIIATHCCCTTADNSHAKSHSKSSIAKNVAANCAYFATRDPNIYSMAIDGPANYVVYRERFEFDQKSKMDDDVISNSSLKDVEALEDELEAYMNELRMRDSQSRFVAASF